MTADSTVATQGIWGEWTLEGLRIGALGFRGRIGGVWGVPHLELFKIHPECLSEDGVQEEVTHTGRERNAQARDTWQSHQSGPEVILCSVSAFLAA